MRLSRTVLLAAVLATATATAVAPGARAADLTADATSAATSLRTARAPMALDHQKPLPLAGEPTPATPGAPATGRRTAAGVTPPVGTVRQWLGQDDYNQTLYRKDYTLMAVGDTIELWVAVDRAFPAGDCRSQPGITDVTPEQAQAMVSEYDDRIYPTESQAFSVAPDRDGSNALIGPDANGNGGDYTGAGGRLVALVDNIRDDGYYALTAPQTPGFFSAQFDELFDRNVLTLDVYDWQHRTGASPPNDPSADLCTDHPARPRLYERQLASDDQHLLLSYTDPLETRFVDDGLSGLALSLLGYANTRASVYQPGSERPLVCFNGFGPVRTTYNPAPASCGGPQNSLTIAEDPENALADQGNAWSFLLYLYDHYGVAFISALHRDGDRQGLAGVQAQLGAGKDVYAVLHDVQAMNLVDRAVGVGGGSVTGRPKALVTTPSLSSALNLQNAAAYAKPGAKPNGADYVGLRDGSGAFLGGRALKTLTLQAAASLEPSPLTWSLVDDDPDRSGDSVLWSGNASSLDAAAVTPVAVPTGAPVLTYLAKYGAEAGYDYAYTEISTDGGATYTPIAGDKTVDGPKGPALNGTTTGFEPHSFDLTPWAGQDVLLAFHYVSDGGVNEGGWLVDDVRINDTVVSDGSSLAPFDSPSEARPTPVANLHTQLVGLDDGGHRALVRSFDGSLSLNTATLAAFRTYPRIIAVVSYDEPTEQERRRARYVLTVNGVTQRGG